MSDSPALPWSLALTCAAVGCAIHPDYAYVPEQPSVVEDGALAERYPVPPERPEGEIRIASFGLTELRLGDRTRLDALHVRVVIANHGDHRAWRFDPQQQVVVFPDEGRARPMLTNSDAAQLPAVAVQPGDLRTVDLYFPLPGSIDDDDDLVGFEVLWRVQTATRVVSQRTRFDRIDASPKAPPLGVVVGYGSWWYDPFYTSFSFIHPPTVIIREAPRRVIVHRHGRRYGRLR